MPSVTYLRLDGGVEASQRQSVVDKFNTDPTYDLLLLTTHVGGLGLNLTGADTVRNFPFRLCIHSLDFRLYVLVSSILGCVC